MTTKRFAVVGNPIAHSSSPALHQLFAQQLGIDLVYDKIRVETDEFASFVKDFFEQGGVGLNVTVPFKQDAYRLCEDRLSERARDAAAVNTLWSENGQTHGCNTDGVGLVNDIARLGFDLRGAKVTLLGAGGAARGAVPALIGAGCATLHIANRTASKAQDLAEIFQKKLSDDQQLQFSGLEELPADQHIVINASSSSIQGVSLRLPEALFNNKRSLAYDMAYTPANDTPFLQICRDLSATHCEDGLGMLVYQGAESFRIWHGQEPDAEPVVAKLRELIQN